ncbi:MAG TPA: hypothetical protein VHD56_10745 [Tepidisphaeraceae bacterium]|nr:hypothetical protein [Tepidisphaeraceae bacterium]
MMTVRQIDKLWDSGAHSQLFRQMISGRPEASPKLHPNLNGPIPAAAMALLRLDELTQSHAPIYRKLLLTILNAQEADGGWGDPLITAVCLRALMAGRGQGQAIDMGLTYLARLQKSSGLWPRGPIQRLAEDPLASALILIHLGSDERFRKAVNFGAAVRWFENNQTLLDPETAKIWEHASVRCHGRRMMMAEPVLNWS